MLSLILTIILTILPINAFTNADFLKSEIDRPEEVDFPLSLGPKLTAKSALVVDEATNEIFFEKNPTEVLPVASITKLMTALAFLENKNKGWDEWVEVEEEDLLLPTSDVGNKEELPPAQLGLRPGEKIKIKDVFYACLIESANDAAKILARLTGPCCAKTFVDLMNERALSLGMTNTYFSEPTGLSPQNYSTAQDLAQLVRAAFRRDEIKQALGKKYYNIPVLKKDGIKRWHRLKNTNKLLDTFVNLAGAKTGYLEESGYCFAGLSRQAERQLVVIILGAETEKHRFQEAKALIWWSSTRFAR